MAEYLVELYLARADVTAHEHGAARARAAAEQLTRDGEPVTYLRSVFVPEDETCLLFYEAVSADAVRSAVELAALPFERITAMLAAEGRA